MTGPFMTYVGIDPGAIGAVAVIHGADVTVFDMPMSATPVGGSGVDDEGLLLLAATLYGLGRRVAVIEHTWGMPGQGGGSQYTFGDTAAAARVAFKAAGFRVERVSSMKWKTRMRVTLPKSFSVERAIQLYPSAVGVLTSYRSRPGKPGITVQQTYGRADAILIAAYAEKEKI